MEGGAHPTGLQELGPSIYAFEEGPFGDGSIFAKTLARVLHEGPGARR